MDKKKSEVKCVKCDPSKYLHCNEHCQNCKPSPASTDGWEKEFDEKFYPLGKSMSKYSNGEVKFLQTEKEVKDFIRSHDQQLRQRIGKEAIDLFWEDKDLQEAICLYGEWNNTELQKTAEKTKEKVLTFITNLK